MFTPLSRLRLNEPGQIVCVASRPYSNSQKRLWVGCLSGRKVDDARVHTNPGHSTTWCMPCTLCLRRLCTKKQTGCGQARDELEHDATQSKAAAGSCQSKQPNRRLCVLLRSPPPSSFYPTRGIVTLWCLYFSFPRRDI